MNVKSEDAPLHPSENRTACAHPKTVITEVQQGIPADLLAEFEAAARRPLRVRLRYAFIHTYKPVLDDARFRSFATTAQYRKWCEDNLPTWLGYGRF